VFFDEIDAIAARRGSGGGATLERMVAQLLTEMDGITQPGGLVVFGATNRPDLIDPALLRPGRFDLVLEMPIPDASSRLAMLVVHAGKMPLADDVDLASIAQATEGCVGADMAGICRLAALAALTRAPHLADLRIEASDFAVALHEQRKGRIWQN